MTKERELLRRALPHLDTNLHIHADIRAHLAAEEKKEPDFCDTHCTWLDHHHDCENGAEEQ